MDTFDEKTNTRCKFVATDHTSALKSFGAFQQKNSQRLSFNKVINEKVNRIVKYTGIHKNVV